jgi:hypothetical protein
MDQSNLEDLDLELDFEDSNSVLPSHSLEINLILCFIYKSAQKYGVSEFDILSQASSNSFGYLTGYTKYLFLKKAFYNLRPINVPQKNKWLRDTTQSLF